MKKCKQSDDRFTCLAKPLGNDDYCFFHSPKTAQARKEASSRGGKANLKDNSNDKEQLELRTEDDVRNLLISTINELRQDKISSKTASVIGYLALQALPLIKENVENEKVRAWFKKHPGERFYEPMMD